MSPAAAVHATCIAVGAAGVLLRGRPGSGKSSLALALASRGGPALSVRLVADDCVHLRAAAGRLVASAPPSTAGLIEARGTGILGCPHLSRAVIRLVVDLVAPDAGERLPEADAATAELCGIALPRITCAPDAAAPDRILAALRHLAAGGSLPALPAAGRIRA